MYGGYNEPTKNLKEKKTYGTTPTYKYSAETREAALNRLAMAKSELLEKLELKRVIDRNLCDEIATLEDITTELI